MYCEPLVSSSRHTSFWFLERRFWRLWSGLWRGEMDQASWQRTGLVVWIVAAGILILLFLVGPLLYAARMIGKACLKEWRVWKERLRHADGSRYSDSAKHSS